ncbi:MAG: protein kinase, partial [Acidobacteriia bacterium]|nr:protein kinase [Terriglobia bacterium]
MPLAAGDRLGPYEILAAIGAGGMGEVYRASDPKLKRDVALKVLPEAFARDPDRMARFQREAEVLASLNHPNIAHIYGVEDRALVMELVGGESPKGPMPFDDAWKIALQIADALEYAHEKGVIHRDLKRANVKVTPDGVVKLLDFGLAKAYSESPDSAAADPENSPTITLGGTVAGAIIGTAAYMAPEQARGKKVDKRADIWAWGVVLCELLTGERLFQGDEAADTLAQVLTKEPKLDRVPARARKLLGRCLEKDPKGRLRDIGEARYLIEEPIPTASTPRFGKAGWIAAACFAIAAAIVGFLHFRKTPTDPLVIRTMILPPDNTLFDFRTTGPMAISPDGRRIVFSAKTLDNKDQLWVRALDVLTAQPLAGTEGAKWPFWSPDSRSLGFFADRKLKRIDIAGGPALTLADAPNPRGGSWSKDGVIVFSPVNTGPLERVSANSGAISPATSLGTGQGSHRFPWFLPDGRHFLFEGQGTPALATSEIMLASLDSNQTKSLLRADSNAIYSGGYLLFLKGNTLMAQAFDLRQIALSAEAVPIAEQVETILIGGRTAAFSASQTGLLAYQTGEEGGRRTLTWFDRSGKLERTVGEPGNIAQIELSPDGKFVATWIEANNNDIWIYDLARGVRTRFTFDPADDRTPVWSPDGRTIVFGSQRKGPADVYRKSADGSGSEELLYEDNSNKAPLSWSPDGKFLLYFADHTKGRSLFILPMTGPLKPIPFVRTASPAWGKFSPDGKWVAYTSDESGRAEIYVAPFPGPGGKRQVSPGGGIYPRWRKDGKEIFYVALDQRLMAAEITAESSRLEVGQVRPLFGPIDVGLNYIYD